MGIIMPVPSRISKWECACQSMKQISSCLLKLGCPPTATKSYQFPSDHIFPHISCFLPFLLILVTSVTVILYFRPSSYLTCIITPFYSIYRIVPCSKILPCLSPPLNPLVTLRAIWVSLPQPSVRSSFYLACLHHEDCMSLVHTVEP